MRLFLIFTILSTLCLQRLIPGIQCLGGKELASTPPRGWNSYDSFSWIISEEEFLQNAQIVAQRLLPHGYNYVVVDYLWYRRNVKGSETFAYGYDVIDEWGRVIPDPDRWPSSRNGKGFTEVAAKVHSMGLKFGIHVMRGISTQSVNISMPILDTTTGKDYEESGRKWYTNDVGIKERACPWLPNCFMSVNIRLGAGRAFLRSLYQQYANWGVDFVKNDCVFGENLDVSEITYVSEVLKELNRPIVYSLSPGSTKVTPAMVKDVVGLVNMYRITEDDWDNWRDVRSHFNISRDFAAANMIGMKGKNGKSWPDMDMLPLGWLTDPGVDEEPHRKSNLTLDEQRTQMTLWCIVRSPIMFGGDMRHLDDQTYRLITNPTLLEINTHSSNNKEFPYISTTTCHPVRNLKENNISDAFILKTQKANPTEARSWIATGRNGKVYVAFFNLYSEKTTISARISDLAMVFPGRKLKAGSCKCREEWSGKDFGVVQKSLSIQVETHGTAVFVLNCS